MGASILLPMISLAMTLLSLVNVLVTYGMAQGDFKYLWSLGSGLAAFIISILIWHDTPYQIACALMLSIFYMLCGCILWRSSQIVSGIKGLVKTL